MSPFQRHRAAPIMPISYSGAAYHTWSRRFQLTSRLLPNRPYRFRLQAQVPSTPAPLVPDPFRYRPVGTEAATGGRSRQQEC